MSGDCVGEACSTTIDSLTLRPGVHTLRLEASDRAGNLAVREISLRLEASFAALLCRFEAPLCAGIAPDGIRNAVEAHLAAAQKHELSGALTTAANELAALVHFVRAQRGKGIPTPCAVAMVAEAEATIRARWGLDLAQLK